VLADWPELLQRAGGYFHGRGAYSQAAPLLRDALAIRKKALGPEHPYTATSLNNLANLLQAQGDFAGARPLYERALANCEKALGPEHPDTNLAHSNLARLLQLVASQPAAALALCETALAAHDKILGLDHAWTKDSARVTADALDALGRTEEAKALREKYGITEPEKPKSS
jgi:tetratricopeptide (TPR) repeat protein